MATYDETLSAARKEQQMKSQKGKTEVDLNKIGRLLPGSQKAIVSFCKAVMEKHKQFPELTFKMDAIDVAYARYKAKVASTDPSSNLGVDTVEANAGCGNVFAEDNVVPPIVVSQVDSYVAYLAEVFLSGTPMFPVVSSPSKRQWAEQLEAILDDHAQLGGYARQLLLFLRDGVKYNVCALETDWDAISQFSVLQDYSGDGQKMSKKAKKFTRIKRLNMRNTVWDLSVAPGDVAEHGDYAGYIERLTAPKLKKLLNKLTDDHSVYNADSAMASSGVSVSGYTPNYRENPQISEYVGVNPSVARNGVDWDGWFEPGKKNSTRRGPVSPGATYEKFTLYARIMPASFGIAAPQSNTPQIWKFIVINGDTLIHAKRIVSAYDYLPILFGQPLEDGLDYQTQSVAEGEIPFQDAASTLFNIRFQAARRAVSDRALYIPDMIKPTDINAPVAAPKIPVHISTLSPKGINDAYHQIPFDMRGTETTIQDAATIVAFSKELHGVNGPKQGAFQKGNKSVQEWNDTMGGSDGRMRLPALVLEHQVFSPLKSILALNLFQYGEDAKVISQVNGKEIDIKIAELRNAVLSFKIADGYTPKSKVASTDVILSGLQLISNSPILQQAYGPYLTGMFAHFMSLAGLKGFEEYNPANQQPANGLPGNLPMNDPRLAGAQPNVLPPTNAAPQIPPDGSKPVV